MFYALVLIAVSVLILRCTRRETATDTLEYWLEKHFPGRFGLLDTQTEDPIRNLSFQVKRSVVADKSDPLVLSGTTKPPDNRVIVRRLCCIHGD